MKTASIRETLSQISTLTENAWEDLSPLFQPISLNRNEYLIREGDRASDCFLLIEGVMRVYYNKEGNEYNKTFFVPGMFPTPITALLSESPSALSFQALVACQLVRFSYAKFRALFDRHRCLEQLLLRILEREWINKERHDINMVTNDATTNYLLFQKTYPGLENLIPQYHIASYLGITPIQLSRIRAQLSRAD